MNILFICTGNTCRSPMAEGYLDSLNLPNVNTESRGLASQGGPISENAIKVMLEKGIDLSDNVSAPLVLTDLLWADKIIYMSESHLAFLRLYAPEDKLLMLGGGILDPFGGDCDVYRKCRDEIFSAIDKLVKKGFFDETVVMKADKTKASQIAELEKECFSLPWSIKTITEAMENGTTFFVAQKGEKTVGYIGISVILDEGYITNIAVTKKERKKGVGTALLERVFAEARDNNLSFISLEVRESNKKAISLYEKFGFKKEGKRKNFYDNPKEDALILTKRF
ncbi:MAG: ribosomal protein S18-alanine N-acetyltransferase [Clostridia bacterium]|nr:ribosomal protein S18-alanine N-acetyltransferase [Clostridia bacterium]